MAGWSEQERNESFLTQQKTLLNLSNFSNLPQRINSSFQRSDQKTSTFSHIHNRFSRTKPHHQVAHQFKADTTDDRINTQTLLMLNKKQLTSCSLQTSLFPSYNFMATTATSRSATKTPLQTTLNVPLHSTSHIKHLFTIPLCLHRLKRR